MIICVCKNVSDKQIRNAISNGCTDFEELQIELGICVNCEKCNCAIREIIVENTMRKE